MTLGQRVAVMRDGRILQADTPHRLYQHPGDLFVAAFIGSPSMNLVEAIVGGSAIRFGQFTVPLAPERTPPDGRVVLGIRPEGFQDAAFVRGLPSIEVDVEVLEDLGSDGHVFFHVDGRPITAESLEAGADAELLPGSALFTARVDPRTRARVGAKLELAVDPTRFLFFDADTGAPLATAGQPELAGAL
jgi:multiple sugar transport system ATP-binding protein